MGSGGFMAGLEKAGKQVGKAGKAYADSMSKSSGSDSGSGGGSGSENIGRKIGTKVRGVAQKYLGKKSQPKGPVKVPLGKEGI